MNRLTNKLMNNKNMIANMIAIGCDHAGVELKNDIVKWLNENNFVAVDCGCKEGEKADYPDIAQAVCQKVTAKECSEAILICGTGIGMSMAANKIDGIRAACCSDYYSAKYTKLHNDANVLCMGARVVASGLALELVEVFLKTEFEGGRHTARVEKIMDLQNK